MSAQPTTFPEWLQQPLDLGVITAVEAWQLNWEELVHPHEPQYPEHLWLLASKVQFFHLPTEPMLH